MATLAQKIQAEKRMRDLLEEGGLPQPDYIEYGYTCIRLIFEEPKLCIIVDIDEPPEGVEPWPAATDDPAFATDDPRLATDDPRFATDDPDWAA